MTILGLSHGISSQDVRVFVTLAALLDVGLNKYATAGTNHVILGGCFQTGSFDTIPDLNLAEKILKDCYNLLPALAGPK